MRILLTGVTGFAGSHLAEALLARGGVELFGISRGTAWPSSASELAGRVQLHTCDLRLPGAIEALLRQVQPQQIYHLAGYANAGASFRETDEAWAGNLCVTRSLYDAVVRWGGLPRILFVGSGMVYGDSGESAVALDENSQLRPTSPYASSKAAADLASYQYTVFPGLDIVRARPFNHIGPRQSTHYAIANWARQIVAIERGEVSMLEHGTLSTQRDLTDVRDMVAAYMLLMERGRSGEAYNIASGKNQRMQEVLDRLLCLAKVPVKLRLRQDLVRKSDPTVLQIDASRLRRETGWTTRYSLEQTLTDILAFWRMQ